jgi:hypothetical protein
MLGKSSAKTRPVADLLIAGGGVAGSSLATMLGRESLTVFEKARFLREKPCGEGLMLFCSVWVPVQRLVAAHFTGFHFQARTLATANLLGEWNSPPQSRTSEAADRSGAD